MTWLLLTRRTGEPGDSNVGKAPILLNADSIQFLQRTPSATRIFLRAGGLDSIEVFESFDEIVAQTAKPFDATQLSAAGLVTAGGPDTNSGTA